MVQIIPFSFPLSPRDPPLASSNRIAAAACSSRRRLLPAGKRRDVASACSSPDSAWFFVLCWSTQGKGRERAGGPRSAEPNRRSRGRIINLGTIWFVVSALIHARICVELIYHVKRINSTRARRNRRISFWGKVCVLGRNLSFPEIGFKLSDDLLEITFHLRCDTVCKI
jgi:hypothetical protein